MTLKPFVNAKLLLSLLGCFLLIASVSSVQAQTVSGGNIITKDVQSLNLTSGDQEFTMTGLKANTKYYVRATATTNSPGNYYNYSTQIEVQESALLDYLT